MSRTYRRDLVELNHNDKPYPYNESWWDYDHALVITARVIIIPSGIVK